MNMWLCKEILCRLKYIIPEVLEEIQKLKLENIVIKQILNLQSEELNNINYKVGQVSNELIALGGNVYKNTEDITSINIILVSWLLKIGYLWLKYYKY